MRFSLSLILLIVQFLLRGRVYFNRSSFECGFQGVSSINVNYRIYFFILLLVFVLFDLEIILLLAFLFNNSYLLFFIFIFFIFFTYYLEV